MYYDNDDKLTGNKFLGGLFEKYLKNKNKNKKMNTQGQNLSNDDDKQAKIAELQEIIATAEETMMSAKRLLANLQPESVQEPMPIKSTDDTTTEDGTVVYGYFDGQIMIGDDGKQYPVPANYASKSKLVEGDKLKLTITKDNRFIYKQIGPVQRDYLIGIVKQDDKGNYLVQTKNKEYRVLLAAATYFKIEPGDEVTLVVPQNGNTVWGAIENVLQKRSEMIDGSSSASTHFIKEFKNNDKTVQESEITDQSDAVDETTSDVVDDVLDISAETSSKNSKKTDREEKDNLTAIEKLEQEILAEKQRQSQQNRNLDNLSDYSEWETESEEPTLEELRQEIDVPVPSSTTPTSTTSNKQ